MNEIQKIKQVYSEKGLNGVRAFIKRHNLNVSSSITEFGLHTNRNSAPAKNSFLSEVPPNTARFHYYSYQVQKGGYRYTVLRAIEFEGPTLNEKIEALIEAL